MKLVFKQKEFNAFSLESLSEFHRTANRLCEEAFVVTAPEGFTEIRLREDQTIANTTNVLYLVKLLGESQDSLKLAKDKWKFIGEKYNWYFKGILKDSVNLPLPIDSTINKDDWCEYNYDV